MWTGGGDARTSRKGDAGSYRIQPDSVDHEVNVGIVVAEKEVLDYHKRTAADRFVVGFENVEDEDQHCLGQVYNIDQVLVGVVHLEVDSLRHSHTEADSAYHVTV